MIKILKLMWDSKTLLWFMFSDRPVIWYYVCIVVFFIVVISKRNSLIIIDDQIFVIVIKLMTDLFKLFRIFWLEIFWDLLTRRLHLLFVDSAVLYSGHVFDVEPLEKSDKVQMLKVWGTKRKFLDNQFNVFSFKLEI
mgnify:CR=1 FL=1